MDRRRSLLTSLAGVLAGPLVAGAQQAEKTPRIGYLGFGSGDGSSASRDAFLQGLRDLGYIEGETIFIEYRWAQGRAERLPVLSRELVAREVKIIVAVGTGPVEAAMALPRPFPLSSLPPATS